MKDRWWELKETKDKVTFSKCSVRIFDQSIGGGGGQPETRFQLHKVKACNNYASRRHLRFVFFFFNDSILLVSRWHNGQNPISPWSALQFFLTLTRIKKRNDNTIQRFNYPFIFLSIYRRILVY